MDGLVEGSISEGCVSVVPLEAEKTPVIPNVLSASFTLLEM